MKLAQEREGRLDFRKNELCIWTVSQVYHICLLVADAIMKGLGRHPFHRQLGTPSDPVVAGTVDVPC